MKDYDRSEAAKRGWVTRRKNQASKIESVMKELQNLTPQNVSKYSKSELLNIAKRANLAVSQREKTFKAQYKQETGREYTKGFNRESFAVSSKSTEGRLRHVVVMQKKFLERKNTFEDFKLSVEKFERRVLARISYLKSPEEEGEENKSLGEVLQKREQEAEPELSVLEQATFKDKFFEFYEKALEEHFGGSEPSKGSPVFAKVGEIMLDEKNKHITLSQLLKKIDEWVQEENKNAVTSDPTQSDFIKTSENNNR